MANGPFEAARGGPRDERAELLELVEDQHDPAPVQARRTIQPEQHLGDSLADPSGRRELETEPGHADGNLRLQLAERLRELRRRGPAPRREPGAEALDAASNPRLELACVVHDEQVDLPGDYLAAEVLHHLLDEARLAHAPPRPEPGVDPAKHVPGELLTLPGPVAMGSPGRDTQGKQLERGRAGHACILLWFP